MLLVQELLVVFQSLMGERLQMIVMFVLQYILILFL